MRMYDIYMESEEEILHKARHSVVAFSPIYLDLDEDTPDKKYQTYITLYDDCSR